MRFAPILLLALVIGIVALGDALSQTPPAPQSAPLPQPVATSTARTAAPAWAPPVLDDPQTITLESSKPFDVKLDDDRDYIIDLPAWPLKSGLKITGGRNVVVIGGEIRIGWQGDDPSTSSRRGLKLEHQRGTVHVEGLLLTGKDLSEGIQIEAPEATVQLVNIRIDELRARDKRNFSDNHPDLVQLVGPVRVLRIDGFTGVTDYQGLFLQPPRGTVEGVELRRVNIRGTETARYLLWRDEDAAWPLTLDDVWAEPASGRRWQKTVWPEPPDPSWAGARRGTPPDGDFVPSDLAGIGYRRSDS